MAESTVAAKEYGKNLVRLMRVRQEGDKHFITELRVDTRLELSSTKDYVDGDNSDVVATDSQKNAVLVLAKQNQVRFLLNRPYLPSSLGLEKGWVGLAYYEHASFLFHR